MKSHKQKNRKIFFVTNQYADDDLDTPETPEQIIINYNY